MTKEDPKEHAHPTIEAGALSDDPTFQVVVKTVLTSKTKFSQERPSIISSSNLGFTKKKPDLYNTLGTWK